MTGNRTFNKLLEPGNIGRVKTKNRIVRTAAGVDYLDEGHFIKSGQELPFYEALARGGVGLIIVGATSIDYPLGTVIQNQLRIDDDKFLPGLRELTQVVHKYDCPTFLQLMHAGPWHGAFNDGLQPVAASSLSKSELQAVESDFGVALRELTISEIEEIVNKFGKAAERAQKAGFDGVEINVATRHLGNSFLSRAWNRRHDAYGVDNLENRARFAIEIVQEVKRRLGQDFPVGSIINGAEYGVDNGITPEDGRGFARILEKAGVDYIQVRAFGYNEYFDLHVPDSIFFPEPPKPLAKPLDGSRHGAGVVVSLAAGIKKVVSIPVVAVGRLDPELGEKILRQGKADFIAFQRRLIADPELPNKVTSGRLDDIVPCTACLHCMGFVDHLEPVRCRINAAVGGVQDYVIKQAPRKKSVVIVGGGPAGMEAARVAALRGHEVILYEKEHKLGGLLPLAAVVKNRELEDLGDIVRYLKAQITKLGVDIRLGREVNPSLIGEIKPDVVIVATGGIPNVPEIPGIKARQVISMPKLHHMLKRYLRFFSPGVIRTLTKLWMPIGKKVVVIGGGIPGCEVAEFLVKRGRRVIMLETAETLQDKRWSMVQNMRIFNWLAKNGVVMMTGVKYEQITDEGLDIVTKEGKKQTIEADSIIPVIPLAPNTELIKSIQGKVSEVYSVGDCSQPGLIIDAIADGYRVAQEI